MPFGVWAQAFWVVCAPALGEGRFATQGEVKR
jgi:hypothetical protein